MKNKKITLCIICLLVLGVFLIINQMTPNPGTSSGNGNPALLIAWVLLPFFFVMFFLWVQIFRKHTISTSFQIISISGITIHLIVAFLYQRYELNKYKQVIKDALIKRDGGVDAEYFNAITKGMSIHINNQNFNFNTYFMFISFSILVSIVYLFLDGLTKKGEIDK